MPPVMAQKKPYGVDTFAAGNSHSAFVSENGTLYVWGRNAAGQLGLGKEWVVVTRPTPLQALKNRRVSGVVAAASHTLALVGGYGEPAK